MGLASANHIGDMAGSCCSVVRGLSGIRELFSNQNAKPRGLLCSQFPMCYFLLQVISRQGQGENLDNDLLRLPAVGGMVGGRISTAAVLG